MPIYHNATAQLLDLARTEGIEVNEDLLGDCLQIANTSPEASDKMRSVEITQDNDGKVNAESIKAYNVLRFSQRQFINALLTLAPAAAGMFATNVVGTVLGVLAFIAAFREVAKKEYSEQDSKVLLAIYHLGSFCHISAIPDKYKELFGQAISEDAVRRTVHLLAAYRTVRLYGNDEVEIKETVVIERA